jgi:hypothetical protein
MFYFSIFIYIIASEKTPGFSYGDESERRTGEGFNPLASPTTISKNRLQTYIRMVKYVQASLTRLKSENQAVGPVNSSN